MQFQIIKLSTLCYAIYYCLILFMIRCQQIVGYFLLFLCIYQGVSVYDITHYGAVRNQDTYAAQLANSKAFMKAIQLANSTELSNQRAVRVPKGTFYFMPIAMKELVNISIEIQGRMAASKIIRKWPLKENQKDYQDFFTCERCRRLEIHGGGKIDGRGYNWWLICILNLKKYLPHSGGRPHLIHLIESQYISIHDIILKNSPNFHLKMQSCYDAEVHNIDIKVNTTAQINLLKKFSLTGVIPLFPLNTDGIDPSGARFHIYNITVQNFDDVVVPKPSHKGSYGGECTEDMLVENATVSLGVGMSIGSVPPNKDNNCIRNIIFRNVRFNRPFKAIYVKTNPGDTGSGIVENIYYKNMTLDRPIWWAIYIGPQQMKQPDGGGPGCMLYPFDRHGTCTTQPLVTLRNITLEDITIHNSLLYPVIIRCNVSNPCTDINFINVRTDNWSIGQKESGYVCEYASGRGEGNQPMIHCLQEDKKSLREQKIDEQQIDQKQYLMILDQMQRAAFEIGYAEEDDEFDFQFDPQSHFSEQEQRVREH